MTRYRGDALAATDLGDYPRHWSSEQRLANYWFALRCGLLPDNPPRSPRQWEALDARRRNHIEHRGERRADEEQP